MELSVALKKQTGPKRKDFEQALTASPPPELIALRQEVEDFAKQFPTIGFERATMRYQD